MASKTNNPEALRIEILFSQRDREALSHHYGYDHPATDIELRSWVHSIVNSGMDELAYELDLDRKRNGS